MNYVVSDMESVKVFNCQTFTSFNLPAYPYPVISFKYLMVRVKAYLGVRAYKPFVDRILEMFKTRIISRGHYMGGILEYAPDPLRLLYGR